jgi:hypothetical protein
MPSSTSSSSNYSANKHIALLLTLLVLFVAALEIGTRRVAGPSSRIERRVLGEFHASEALRPGPPGGPKTALVVGNSLLLFGLDMDALQSQVGANWRTQRFVIESTAFTDWYFGLRRLFAEGTRPDAVLLVLAPLDFAHNGTRGDYTARYLMRPADLPQLISAAHVHPTVGSGYLLARYSYFYALRAELRKQVSLAIFPGLRQMLAMLVPKRGESEPGAGASTKLEAMLGERAAALAELSRTSGVPITVVLPPSGADPKIAPEEQRVLNALGKAGVPASLPWSSAQTVEALYSDGFHLNDEGRRQFTSRFAAMMQSFH